MSIIIQGMRYVSAAIAAVVAPTDTFFKYVTALINGTGPGSNNNVFLDSSTNNLSITKSGSPTQGTFSPFSVPEGNWSNYFDGSSYFVLSGKGSDPNFTLTGDFTVEGWFNVPTTNPLGLFWCGLDNGGWGVLVYNNNVYFETHVNYTDTVSGSHALNTWTHFAAVRSGSTLTMYINGVATQSITYSSTLTPSADPSVGAMNAGSLYKFNGHISNLRIVKGTAVYTSNFTPSTAPLTAISGTVLLTCQSNRFKDNSTNAYDLTPSGSPVVSSYPPFKSGSYSTTVNGGSAYFDGGSNYLTLPTNSNLTCSGDFTIEFWVWASEISGSPTVINGQYNGIGTLQIDGPNFIVWDGWNAHAIIPSMLPNVWYHVAVTRSGSTVKVFCNGTQADTWSQSDAYDYSASAIGWRSISPTGYYWHGYVTDFRVIKGTAIYTANFTPPSAPLTAVTNTSLLCNFTNSNIYDASGTTDIVNNGVTTTTGLFNQNALSFNGSNYLLGSPSSSLKLGTGDFTLEFWLNPTTAASQTQGILGIGNADTGALEVWFNKSYNGQKVSINVYGGTQVDSVSAVSLNTWTHIAFVRSSSTMNIYINGILDTSASMSDNLSNATGFAIGRDYYNLSQEYYTGYLQDLRITKGYARYTSNFTPPSAALPTQ